MNFFGRKAIKLYFSFICFSVVFVMISYWVYKYEVEDRDIAVVDYLSIGKMKHMPVPTFCFMSPFVEQKFKLANIYSNTTRQPVNGHDYLEYPKGDRFESTFNDNNFKNLRCFVSSKILLVNSP